MTDLNLNVVTLEEAEQEKFEKELMQQGLDKALAEAASAFDRAVDGSSAMSLPNGKKVFQTTFYKFGDFLKQKVEEELQKSRRSKFYTELIAPKMLKHLEAKEKAYKDTTVVDNPVDVLSYFVAQELCRLLVTEDMNLTLFARKILRSFNIAYNDFSEGTDDQLVAMIQIIRTYLLSAENVYFKEMSTEKGIVVVLNDKAQNLFVDKIKMLQELDDFQTPYKPMLVKPRNHTNLLAPEGGYLVLESPLLKDCEIDMVRQVPFTANSKYGRQFFEQVNAFQSTQWKLNTDMLDWLKTCDHKEVSKVFNTDTTALQVEVNKLRRGTEKEVRRLQKAISKNRLAYTRTEDEESRKEFVRQNLNMEDTIETLERELKEAQSELGKRRGWEQTLTDAEMFKDKECFYHPVFLDNRGRVYTYNTSLSFQGSSLSKCLIRTRHEERMTAQGLIDLKILLGGMFDGYDKKKAPVRLAKVDEELANILACASHQDYSVLDKIDGDELFCAIVLMREIYLHMTNPEHKTGILAYIDSTSSAIQIQGLIQKCEKAAHLTNLTQTEGEDLPDAYKAVAASGKELVADIAKQTDAQLYAAMQAFLLTNSQDQLAYAGINIQE